MKKVLDKFFMFVVLSTLLFSFSACGSDDDDDTNDSGYPITVTYKVTTANNSNISTIAYYNGKGGTATVQNVASGWTKEVTIESGYPTMAVAASGVNIKGEIIRNGKVVAESDGITTISVYYATW